MLCSPLLGQRCSPPLPPRFGAFTKTQRHKQFHWGLLFLDPLCWALSPGCQHYCGRQHPARAWEGQSTAHHPADRSGASGSQAPGTWWAWARRRCSHTDRPLLPLVPFLCLLQEPQHRLSTHGQGADLPLQPAGQASALVWPRLP